MKLLEASIDENKSRLLCVDSFQHMKKELKLEDDVLFGLEETIASTECEKNNLELRNQGCSLIISKLEPWKYIAQFETSCAVTECQLNEAKEQ